jgi:hypothetical protein
MFILFDNRHRRCVPSDSEDTTARAHTGKRRAYEFIEVPSGVRALWDLVLKDEVPDEYDDYAYLAEGPMYEVPEVFNDYWGIYGWYLASFEDGWVCPDDVEVCAK